MARRNTLLDDLYAIAVCLPWWINILIAIVLYMLFHSFAIIELDTAVHQGEIARASMDSIYKFMSAGLQYILPLPFILGAIFSLFKGRK